LIGKVVFGWTVATSTKKLHVGDNRHLDVVAFVIARGGELVCLDTVVVVTMIVLVTAVYTIELVGGVTRMSCYERFCQLFISDFFEKQTYTTVHRLSPQGLHHTQSMESKDEEDLVGVR